VEYDSDNFRDFALALEYTVRRYGADSPAQLRSIAYALNHSRWNLPRPEPLTADGSVTGYKRCLGECVVERLVDLEPFRAPACRKLLEPISPKPVIRKFCYVGRVAGLVPGGRLVAARVTAGTAAYIENAVIGAEEACRYLQRGWACVFVDPEAERLRPAAGGISSAYRSP
jgi:hypothetical protein